MGSHFLRGLCAVLALSCSALCSFAAEDVKTGFVNKKFKNADGS